MTLSVAGAGLREAQKKQMFSGWLHVTETDRTHVNASGNPTLCFTNIRRRTWENEHERNACERWCVSSEENPSILGAQCRASVFHSEGTRKATCVQEDQKNINRVFTFKRTSDDAALERNLPLTISSKGVFECSVCVMRVSACSNTS